VSKHNIFESYLEPWAKIISNQAWVKDAYYIDAFAGTGKYETGEAGSPVIAAKILIEYQKPTCTLHCICIERDPKRYKTLETSLNQFEGKLAIEKHKGEFLTYIDGILKKIEKAPAFFFIDPEGFSGMDFDKIEAVLNLPHTEILINFQYNAIQRWLKAPKVESTITKLFGTSDYKKAKKEIELIEIYKQQIRQKNAFVRYFRNKFPKKNRTFYYLVYATKNITGFKIMKDVIFKEESKRYFEPCLFAEIDFQSFQKQVFNKYKGKKSIEYNSVLGFVLQETDYLARDLDKVLKNIGVQKINNPRQKYNPFLNFPVHNPSSRALKNLPKKKTETLAEIPLHSKKVNIYYKEYKLINGKKRELVSRVNDGSIIIRFDKTPLPKSKTDVVCPHFLELKWAYGCPYDCAWCYLKGTFRFQPKGKLPVVKPYEKIELHTRKFLEEVKTPEILNAGEIADSLMHENTPLAFSKFIIPFFETQNRHKVLFLTKSSSVNNLLEILPHNQVIISFSLNAIPVAKRWEKAPSVLKRIEAAKKVFDVGYEVRIRIDPMVPVKNWQEHYLQLLDILFDNIKPERITLGSLRGLQSTINGCSDKSWVKYLGESSNWGKKIDFNSRYDMYLTVIEQLKSKYSFKSIALCKETVEMWDALKIDYKKIKCNCIW
ncbi:MAG: three-Cys-motif partner protein TcmP, partial [Candidatus Omnitrophica bacterium]|nr:three-Cys-motif partner protein TcmP [Candidatus Omnitrophota bacterium]